MTNRLVWDRDGLDWPYRETSRFVEAAGLRWHVQIAGDGPLLLLLHGTGASTHSWRRLWPLLTPTFKIVAPDLPGHGFTSMPDARGLSLPGMAAAVGRLLSALRLSPIIAVGHSAGAAVAIRAALDGGLDPKAIVSINGALRPFGSVVGQFFSPLAKLLVSAPMVPQIMAWRAQDRRAVEQVIRGTGSNIEDEDLSRYARLFANPGHVAGALGMMANWDLNTFERDLPKLKARLVLIAAENDRAVPPGDAAKVAALVPGAVVERVAGCGHLAHEERPQDIARLIAQTYETLEKTAWASPNSERERLLR